METETQENFDSQTEDQETIDSTNDEAEETTEESTEESGSEDEKYTETEKQLYARAKKAEKRLKELESKKEDKTSDKSSKEEVSDALLSRLEVRGVLEKEDQDYVLRFAKSEGLSPIDALNDSIVQDRLKANERKRKSADATPRSNNRTGSKADEVDAAVRQFKKDGTLPENNPALTSKILDRLKEGA